jgi:hypothetical protein
VPGTHDAGHRSPTLYSRTICVPHCGHFFW